MAYDLISTLPGENQDPWEAAFLAWAAIIQDALNTLPPGTTLTNDYTKNGGTYGTERLSSQTNVTQINKGPTDPSAVAIDGDAWKITAS
jgi:hypothetical protein